MRNVAVSWTGGKDSSLALYEAERLGCRICCLVTFAPPGKDSLAHHPPNFIKLQAEALGLPHYLIGVEDPFDRSYERAIASVKERQGIDTLVTGDIGEVSGHDPNWIVERGGHCGVDVLRPLWHWERDEVLEKILALNFRAVFSCVKRPWFNQDWLGLELSQATVERLNQLSENTGLDICGEEGEYHTMVVDAPRFRKRIQIESYSKRVEGSVMYLVLGNLSLTDKDVHKQVVD